MATASPRARARSHDGRADGARDRLLPRPRRLDARGRPRAQHPGRERHRRRRHAALGRRRARDQAPGRRSGGRSRSSATAPTTRASSTNRSISRPCGGCRCCSCARTTITRSAPRTGTAPRSSRWRARAAAYGIPGVRIDGNDVVAVHGAIGEAVARARAGDGPSLIEAHDLALGPAQHARQPAATRARTRRWRTGRRAIRSPGCAAMLSEREIVAVRELDAIDAAAKQELDDAVAFAASSPEPERICSRPRSMRRTSRIEEPAERGSRELTFAQALNEAMAQEMERDPTRVPDGRGRRRDRRHLPGEQGPDGPLRRGAGARHADLRGDLLRRRRRRRDRRHAARSSRCRSSTSSP